MEGTGSSGDRRSSRRLSADARSAPLILSHAPSTNGADCPRLVVCDENMRWACVGARTQSKPGVFLFPHQASPPAGRRPAVLDAASAFLHLQHTGDRNNVTLGLQLSLSPSQQGEPPGCLLVTSLSLFATWLTCYSKHPLEELKGTAVKWSHFIRRT